MMKQMAQTDQDDDWATPHVKKAIKVESKIWVAVGIVAVVILIAAAVR